MQVTKPEVLHLNRQVIARSQIAQKGRLELEEEVAYAQQPYYHVRNELLTRSSRSLYA